MDFTTLEGSLFNAEEWMKGTITITFGDAVENHVGMQQIGTVSERGLSVKELEKARTKLLKEYPDADISIVDLTSISPVKVEETAVLIIRDGVRLLGSNPDEMFDEHVNLDWDKHAIMYKRVVNKKARWNICYADFDQEPNYEEGKGRVVSFERVPETSKLRSIIPQYLSCPELNAEGNYYYNPRECGIGWHGDTERRIVVGVRLGVSIPLCFRWYHRAASVSETLTLKLNHGDIYVMSEKAVGFDWKKKATYTLRHSAGSSKFIS